MLRAGFSVAIILGAIFGVACQPALAQSNRTFVSGSGNDANNCAITTPCRTFAYALTQTNAGGEIAVLNTAGYGPVTINKAISIIAPDGIEAGITAPSSAIGVYVVANPGDIVTLRGLTINGGGSGNTGISFYGGSTLIVKNCIVREFGNGIVVAQPASSTTVSDTVLSNNSNAGMLFQPTGAASLTFERVELIGNVRGFYISSASAAANTLIKATGVDSIATGNGYAFQSVSSGDPNFTPLMLDNVAVLNNAVGVVASGGTIILSRSAIKGNTSSGYRIDSGIVKTYGDNRISDTDNTGTLTPTSVQ